jgi:hemoglobin
MMDVAAYLERIGYSGPATPNAETLRDIHRAHLFAVPFENLDIGWKREIHINQQAFLRKIIEDRREGFCYESNGAFAALLEALGFKVTMLSARAPCADGSYGPEFDYLDATDSILPARPLRSFIMQSAEKPSLYDRLGGVYSIATVVDDLIDRVMADPRLNANPLVDEAHHRVPPAGFKYLVTEMVCSAAGGPQKYTGRSMAESHKQLKITGKEWDAFVDDLWLTLDKFKVPAEEQAELRAIVNSTRADIVFDSAHAQGAA